MSEQKKSIREIVRDLWEQNNRTDILIAGISATIKDFTEPVDKTPTGVSGTSGMASMSVLGELEYQIQYSINNNVRLEQISKTIEELLGKNKS